MLRPLVADLKLPTFDGHLNQSNTDWRRWFDAIHTAQEIDLKKAAIYFAREAK